jgi:hypothetical protein
MRRGFWFVAGAGAGVYAMVRARRAAETFTPDGVRDRVAGLGVGAHLFADEVRAGMVERETELRERFGMVLDGPPQLEGRSDRGVGSGAAGAAGVSGRSLALAPQPPDDGLAPQPPHDGLAAETSAAGLPAQAPHTMEGTH